MDWSLVMGGEWDRRPPFLIYSLKRPSATTHALIQRLCLILGFPRDLLSIEKLSDSCILQMVKACFSTFLAENIQVLQLKAIDLLCGVFSSYAQHRNFLIDETVSLMWKLPSSKKAFRSYHLRDEDQKQIQMVTALFIQLVQSSCDIPEMMKTKLPFNSISDDHHKTITDTCCQFWIVVHDRPHVRHRDRPSGHAVAPHHCVVGREASPLEEGTRGLEMEGLLDDGPEVGEV